MIGITQDNLCSHRAKQVGKHTLLLASSSERKSRIRAWTVENLKANSRTLEARELDPCSDLHEGSLRLYCWGFWKFDNGTVDYIARGV